MLVETVWTAEQSVINTHHQEGRQLGKPFMAVQGQGGGVGGWRGG